MSKVNMDILSEMAELTYISADLVEKTEEQLHKASEEIWKRASEMEAMTPVERFQFQMRISDKYI